MVVWNTLSTFLFLSQSFGSFGASINSGQISASNSVSSSSQLGAGHQGGGHPGTASGTVDLFVRHLHESVDDRALFAAFEPFDGLLNARVHTDDDGFSKG